MKDSTVHEKKKNNNNNHAREQTVNNVKDGVPLLDNLSHASLQSDISEPKDFTTTHQHLHH